MTDASIIADGIRATARRLGFDLVGIAGIEPSRHRDHFRRWLDAGHAGTMDYLAARFEERVDAATYFAGVQSIICVAMNYHVPLEKVPESEKEHHGRVARYALGDDYHILIKGRLHQLADWIRQAAPESRTRCAVDTAPIMERELAARAGIGWVGKNTCIIHPRVGSWIFLGEVLTTLALPPDAPITDHCGTCTRCIDACPTNALSTPYQLEARRCISYLTIENRAEIASDFKEKLGEWLYGCDICQDVCPWNHRAPTTDEPALAPRQATGTLDLRMVADWRAGEPNSALRRSAMKRVKLPVLKRNAEIVATNLSRAAGVATEGAHARLETSDARDTHRQATAILRGLDS
jgi:epoxyqueuosine reductase